MSESNYDKVAERLMSTKGAFVTLSFDEVQGLLREFRQRQFALEAVLLFHSGGPWDDVAIKKWRRITKAGDASTKSLCDHIRKVLGRGAHDG